MSENTKMYSRKISVTTFETSSSVGKMYVNIIVYSNC